MQYLPLCMVELISGIFTMYHYFKIWIMPLSFSSLTTVAAIGKRKIPASPSSLPPANIHSNVAAGGRPIWRPIILGSSVCRTTVISRYRQKRPKARLGLPITQDTKAQAEALFPYPI